MTAIGLAELGDDPIIRAAALVAHLPSTPMTDLLDAEVSDVLRWA